MTSDWAFVFPSLVQARLPTIAPMPATRARLQPIQARHAISKGNSSTGAIRRTVQGGFHMKMVASGD